MRHHELSAQRTEETGAGPAQDRASSCVRRQRRFSAEAAGALPTELLSLTWPTFLDKLHSDVQEAMEELYRLARELFRIHPPRHLRRVPRSDREDALHDVIYHCCKDGFRVLRTYRDQGTPFSYWLRRVADRRISAGLGQRGEPAAEQVAFAEEIASDATPDATADLREALAITMKCLGRMDEESRLLLLASASGLTPLETTRLLGWPREHNRRVSDKCRYVRNRLKRMVREEGVDLSTLFSDRSNAR